MAERLPKASELRQMSSEQLQQSLQEVVKNIYQLRFRSSTERKSTSNELTQLKRHIARIKTIERERTLAQQPK